MTIKHNSDSTVQREAEREMLDWFIKTNGVQKIEHALLMQPDGCYQKENTIYLVEAYARIGDIQGAQINKLTNDILKMLYCENVLKKENTDKEVRKVILIIDDRPKKKFEESSWRGQAAKSLGVHFEKAEISETTKQRVEAAQKRQQEGMKVSFKKKGE